MGSTDCLGDLTKYQKDPKYPPNKSEQWNFPPQDDTWTLSHQALRGELDEIAIGLKATLKAFGTTTTTTTTPSDEEDHTKEKPDKVDALLPEWKVKSLQSMWNYHKEHVLAHHQAEDRILRPFLETRIRYPISNNSDNDNEEQLILGGQHLERIAALVDNVDKLVQSLSSSSSSSKKKKTIIEQEPQQHEEELTEENKMKSLQMAFSNYADTIKSQMQKEESCSLPLMRAFFTQAECNATSQKMGMEGGHCGSFVHYAGEDYIRKNFMVKQKIPFFVWRVAFSPAMKKYKQNVILPRMALEENKIPEQYAADSNCIVM